jgi:hypothetical protein
VVRSQAGWRRMGKRQAQLMRRTWPGVRCPRAASTQAFSSRRVRWLPPHASDCTAAPRASQMGPSSSCRFRGAC